MAEWPSGTVTFLFTDIEGSTRRWEHHPQAMAEALARHDALLRGAIEDAGGAVFKTVGDAFCAIFPTPDAAIRAAITAQRALAAGSWVEIGGLRVRMAIHTGAAEERGGDYFGPHVNRVARLLSAAHGGQILVSGPAAALARPEPEMGIALRDLGRYRLRDLIETERLYQLLAPELPADFPPPKTLDAQLRGLPVPPTPLLGREREVTSVRSLLGVAEDGSRDTGAARLVTLTGPGGAGKTRLSLHLAATLAPSFEDGIVFVPLAALTEPSLVLQEIATRLEVTDIGGAGTQEALITFLAPLDLFMVLDNFEQVMAATPLVAELLAACPRLTVLATSRAPLRLRAEREFPVPPLAQKEAVRLFVERGQAVRPDFRLTAETLPVVAAIVSRVDGLPLAIELAAARVRAMPPAALLARLERRLPLLSGGPRDLPLRQQTMRDTIAWSYDLLAPVEQVFFRLLAVFVGGFALEAAEAISAAAPDASGDLQSFAPFDVVEGITSLIDHSLLQQSAAAGDETPPSSGGGLGGEPRYTMLETVREFGLERLAAGGKTEEHAVRGAHAAWCLALAEEAEVGLSSPEQRASLDRLEAEHDNLRAALAWSLEQEDGELALRLSTALEPFWQIRGFPGEGLAWIEQALAKGANAASTIRARALQRLGRLAINVGDFDRAQAVFEAGLALRRQGGDRLGVAQSLSALGFIASYREAFPKARALYEEALAIHRELGDQHGIARSLYNLSDLLREEGDLAAARHLGQDSLVLWKELGDTDMVAYLTWSLAVVDRLEGRSADASRRGEEALALFRELRDLPGIDNALLELGQTALQRGDLQQAAHHFGEVLTRNRELGSRQAMVEGLEGLAAVAAGRGQFVLAARLLGAATAERAVKRFPVVPRGDGPALAARIEAARLAAPEAWEAAQTLPLEQIVAEAQTALPSSELAGGDPPASEQQIGASVTPTAPAHHPPI